MELDNDGAGGAVTVDLAASATNGFEKIMKVTDYKLPQAGANGAVFYVDIEPANWENGAAALPNGTTKKRLEFTQPGQYFRLVNYDGRWYPLDSSGATTSNI